MVNNASWRLFMPWRLPALPISIACKHNIDFLRSMMVTRIRDIRAKQKKTTSKFLTGDWPSAPDQLRPAILQKKFRAKILCTIGLRPKKDVSKLVELRQKSFR